MTSEQKSKCSAIIHTASVSGAAAAAGMAQLPGADVPLLIGIEVTMVIALGGVFGEDINETTAKAIVASAAASYAGRGIAQALVGWLPGIGNVINASTAAVLIETIGWAVANDFANKYNYST
ncbi:hypothetical protein [Clostridium thailandense]|uniref:DUF697 domain-containing protein n=1 Tax=Clostridium thailandense TaxID=2794346 RepID=A0A949TH05_9CLOT|nr:hypothetical protein [Clostridium thailandense]MBV7272070.1 hypothetical protein [Clostridium thailandense]